MNGKSQHVGKGVADEGQFRSKRWLQADKLTPLGEAATHDLAVVHRSQQVPPRSEQRCNYSEDRQEALRVPWEFESPHAALPFSGGLVRILCPVVKPSIPAMLNAGQ